MLIATNCPICKAKYFQYTYENYFVCWKCATMLRFHLGDLTLQQLHTVEFEKLPIEIQNKLNELVKSITSKHN